MMLLLIPGVSLRFLLMLQLLFVILSSLPKSLECLVLILILFSLVSLILSPVISRSIVGFFLRLIVLTIMPDMKFFTRFDPPVGPAVVAKGGLTQQQWREDCDINTILRRYKIGIPPPTSPAQYVDMTERPRDLLDAWERIQVASDWFDSLPSDVRSKCSNDPRVAIRLVMSDTAAAVTAGLLPAVSPPAGSPPAGSPNLSKAAAAATPDAGKKEAEPPTKEEA